MSTEGGKKVEVVKSTEEAIKKMRKHLETRLKVLDANQLDRGVNSDELHQLWEEEEALKWLQEEDKKNKYREQEHEYAYLFISSASRDPYAFPDAGHFKVALSGEIDNVIKSELVQASFPLVDPTVNTANYRLRFSLNTNPMGVITVNEIRVPVGSYKGEELAVEITRQMNQLIFEAQILAGTYTVDNSTGFVLSGGSKPAGVYQMYCNWVRPSQRFIFQWVDENMEPDATQVFALHVQPRPPRGAQVPARFMNDDLWEVLGFNRIDFEAGARYDAPSDTYYIMNTDNVPAFNGIFGENALSPDLRYRLSVRSNQAADLRGNVAVVLDIEPLNDNDMVRVQDEAGTGALTLSDYFGFFLLRDPANVTDRMADVTTNTFPVRKYYREGRSRINSLTVTMRRPDGTVFTFGGVNYFLTIRLTITRTQPPKPMFARGG